jgi:hypothetical protein
MKQSSGQLSFLLIAVVHIFFLQCQSQTLANTKLFERRKFEFASISGASLSTSSLFRYKKSFVISIYYDDSKTLFRY